MSSGSHGHTFAEEGQDDGKRVVSPLILKVPSVSGTGQQAASVPKARKQIVAGNNAAASAARVVGKMCLNSKIQCRGLFPSQGAKSPIFSYFLRLSYFWTKIPTFPYFLKVQDKILQNYPAMAVFRPLNNIFFKHFSFASLSMNS